MKASTQWVSAIIISAFCISASAGRGLTFVPLCSPASSVFFMDRLPLELHKLSLICYLSASPFKAKGAWSQLIAPLGSKQDLDETLYSLCISDHQTPGQEWKKENLKSQLSAPDHRCLGTAGRRKTCLSFHRGPPHASESCPVPLGDLSPFGMRLSQPKPNTPENASGEIPLELFLRMASSALSATLSAPLIFSCSHFKS